MPAKRNEERDGENGFGMAFTLDAPVDLATFDMELAKELGVPGPIGLVAEGDLGEASKENPRTVWIMQGDVDTNVFKRVFTAHDGESARAQESSFTALVRKVQNSDEPLTDDEIQLALRMILRRAR